MLSPYLAYYHIDPDCYSDLDPAHRVHPAPGLAYYPRIYFCRAFDRCGPVTAIGSENQVRPACRRRDVPIGRDPALGLASENTASVNWSCPTSYLLCGLVWLVVLTWRACVV